MQKFAQTLALILPFAAAVAVAPEAEANEPHQHHQHHRHDGVPGQTYEQQRGGGIDPRVLEEGARILGGVLGSGILNRGGMPSSLPFGNFTNQNGYGGQNNYGNNGCRQVDEGYRTITICPKQPGW